MTNRREFALILFFCLAAALRVFIFSAGFPFFSNIDEDLHFDVIMQYSHARLPRSFDLLKEETLEWIVPYASPEFLAKPDQFPDAKFPSPLWKQSPAEAAPELATTKAAWSTEINFESSQPPLYYALASVWWRIGKHIGLTGIQSLYWIRFLNVPLIAIVVWLGFVTARTIAPERVDLRIGVPMLLAFIAKLVSLMRQRPSAGLMALAALVLCAAIPVSSWMIWTKYQFGDLTGSATKITLLGWARKPFADWLHHPIFTPRGFWVFWSDLITNFWRGEVRWHGRPLSWQVADGFYAISSLILLGAAIMGLRKRAGPSAFQRQAIGIAILSFVTSVGFLALLSIQFDFGSCINPSRGHPYFTSGRLLNGTLIPFALLYVYGISSLLRRASAVLPLVVLGAIVVFVTTSEILIDRVVFASEHNWFHR